MEEKTITEQFERDIVDAIIKLMKNDEYRENIAFITTFIGRDGMVGRSWNIPERMAPGIIGAFEFTKLEIMDVLEEIKHKDKKSEEKDVSE